MYCRSKFFDYNRGVRQGWILSPLLFNLYLNDIPFLLDNSCDTDSIILPNGLPLNCLFYADDLVLISRSASGLQKQIDILQNYVEKWLLKINPHKTKVLIFQKQNRKATREKHSFFLNGNQIVNTPEYTYLGTTFNSNGSFATSKKKSPDVPYLLVKDILNSTNFLYPNVISWLMPNLPPFFYTVRKYGGHMIASIWKNGRKIPLSVFTHSFTNPTLA